MPGIVCDGLFERILRSCSEELEKCADVAVNDEALQSVCATLQLEEVKEVGSSVLRLPLQFDDTASEVNFLAILHLLSFGSGYEPLLQARAKHLPLPLPAQTAGNSLSANFAYLLSHPPPKFGHLCRSTIEMNEHAVHCPPPVLLAAPVMEGQSTMLYSLFGAMMAAGS